MCTDAYPDDYSYTNIPRFATIFAIKRPPQVGPLGQLFGGNAIINYHDMNSHSMLKYSH